MIDCYGREINYMRLSVTELCNLRCRYCMPAEGVCKKRHEEMLTEDEMLTAVSAAAELGITKLRITGGEPLVKKNILSICERAAATDGIRELCITTNGVLLPKLAPSLKSAGVSRVNISLDTLRPERFEYITRCGRLDDTLRGIDVALSAGFDKVKLNCVLIGGFNDDEIRDIAALTLSMPLDVRFIELMPMYDSGDFGKAAFLSADAVLEALPEAQAQENDGGVAKLYRLPGALGNIGLISPLSAHFCGSCSRIRLTADGKIKPCLHSSAEFCLKGLDREGMLDVMRSAILAKPQWHGQLSYTDRSRAQRNMNQIGG